MPRKSLALFLAITGLITTLTACGGGQEANEGGGDETPSGQTASPAKGVQDKTRGTSEPRERDVDDEKDREGGEGGEGGEG
jgi:hypothetical protein